MQKLKYIFLFLIFVILAIFLALKFGNEILLKRKSPSFARLLVFLLNPPKNLYYPIYNGNFETDRIEGQFIVIYRGSYTLDVEFEKFTDTDYRENRKGNKTPCYEIVFLKNKIPILKKSVTYDEMRPFFSPSGGGWSLFRFNCPSDVNQEDVITFQINKTSVQLKRNLGTAKVYIRKDSEL